MLFKNHLFILVQPEVIVDTKSGSDCIGKFTNLEIWSAFSFSTIRILLIHVINYLIHRVYQQNPFSLPPLFITAFSRITFHIVLPLFILSVPYSKISPQFVTIAHSVLFKTSLNVQSHFTGRIPLLRYLSYHECFAIRSWTRTQCLTLKLC